MGPWRREGWPPALGAPGDLRRDKQSARLVLAPAELSTSAPAAPFSLRGKQGHAAYVAESEPTGCLVKPTPEPPTAHSAQVRQQPGWGRGRACARLDASGPSAAHPGSPCAQPAASPRPRPCCAGGGHLWAAAAAGGVCAVGETQAGEALGEFRTLPAGPPVIPGLGAGPGSRSPRVKVEVRRGAGPDRGGAGASLPGQALPRDLPHPPPACSRTLNIIFVTVEKKNRKQQGSKQSSRAHVPQRQAGLT